MESGFVEVLVNLVLLAATLLFAGWSLARHEDRNVTVDDVGDKQS